MQQLAALFKAAFNGKGLNQRERKVVPVDQADAGQAWRRRRKLYQRGDEQRDAKLDWKLCVFSQP